MKTRFSEQGNSVISKPIWDPLKKAPPYPHEMQLQNKVAENDEGKANLFNQYFQNVFNLKTNNTNVEFGPNTFNKITCCQKQVTEILSSLK